MGKQNDAYEFVLVTGTGQAIGTDIDLAGFFRSSDAAGSAILVSTAGTVIGLSAQQFAVVSQPIAILGPVTLTSSAGTFAVVFKKRNV